MHGITHLAVEVIFILGIIVFFTLFIVLRPGASQPPSKKMLLGCVVVGLVISAVFLATNSLYLQTTIG